MPRAKGKTPRDVVKTPATAKPKADKDAAAAKAAENAADASSPAETLLGSSTMKSTYEIDGATVQLGELVIEAHKSSGLDVKAWNALAEADRDELIGKVLEERKAAAPPPAPLQNNPSEQPKAGGGGDAATPAPDRKSPLEFARQEVGMLSDQVDKLLNAGKGADALALIDGRLRDIDEGRPAINEMERLLRKKRFEIGGDAAVESERVMCWTQQLVNWAGKTQPIGTQLTLPKSIFEKLQAGGEVTDQDPAKKPVEDEPAQ